MTVGILCRSKDGGWDVYADVLEWVDVAVWRAVVGGGRPQAQPSKSPVAACCGLGEELGWFGSISGL